MTRPLQTRAAGLLATHPGRAGLVPRLALVVLALLATAVSAAAQLTFPVYTADFNHDGIPDALVLSTTSPTATIALGSVPYGTFSASSKTVTFPGACTTGFKPGSNYAPIVIADVNGDGIPDIAFDCIGSSSQYIGTMLGNGDGTFAAATQLPGTSGSVDSFLAGDFNQDGKMDLVTIGETFANDTFLYQIKFYAGDGAGHFAQPVSTTIGDTGGSQYPAYSSVKPDLNGDGYPDLVLLSGDTLTSTGDGLPNVTVSVFGNNKDGTFGVVSGSTSSPNTTVQLGSFSSQVTPYVFPSSIQQGSVYSASGTDLIVNDRGTAPGIFTLKNTSTATTYSLGTPAKTAFTGLTDSQVGRVSGTAFDDVVATNGTSFSVLVNDGAGNFTAAYTALTAPNGGANFAVLDANFDGYSDIYTALTNATGGLNFNVNLVSGSATATAAPITLGIGSKAISAAWTGNVNLLGSTTTGTQLVNGIPSLAAVSSSSNPSVVGAPVTLTALVSPITASTLIPSGLLTLKDNGNTLTSGMLDSTGKLTYTTSALTQGTHAITATYAGDTLFAGAISTALSQVVKNQAVAPILTWATPAPITYGTPLSATQLDAIATDATGAIVPGVFTYAPPAGTILSVGTHTLGVTFVPTDTTNFLTATQSVVQQVIKATPVVALGITSGGEAVSTIAAGSVATLTATVTAAGSPLAPGQVLFCDAGFPYCTDTHLLGTAQLTANGTATLRFIPGIGSHLYKAEFLGNSSSTPTTSEPQTLDVTGKYQTQTTITASGTSAGYTLKGSVVGIGSVLPPFGTLSFLDLTNNTATLGTATLGNYTAALSFTGVASPTGIENPQTRSVVADFNGDGILDVATANTAPDQDQTVYSNTVTISLGNGDGTFRTLGIGPTTGHRPESVVVADFNGDGKPDLAIANSDDATVTILLGNGDGTFTAAASPATAADPYSLTVGDFNGDGNADLAVSTASEVTILLGNGDGTFTALHVPVTGPLASIVTADFNGDGNADLAVQTYYPARQLNVLLGNGDGTFTALPGIPEAGTASNLNATVIGDFNGDGKTDLAVADGAVNTVTIFLGNGDGTFAASPAASAVGSDPIDIQTVDFNGDGKLDLAVINFGQTLNGAQILLGNGDGTFTLPAIAAGTGAYDAVAVGDFNGDGVPDLLSTAGNNLEAALTTRTQTATAILPNVAVQGGTHQVIAAYPGNANFLASSSAPTPLIGIANVPTLTWTPAVPTIVYGTPLGPQQLDAVATGLNGVTLEGTFTYTPAAGTILHAGSQKLGVTFTPADTSYTAATATTTIAVTQATPVLTWTTPASIAYGVPLGAAQLDATVAGVTGAALPGVFTYTPPAGTVLTPGIQTLNVSFAPTDALDYTNATGSVKLTVTGLTSTSVSPSTVTAGSGNTTITITGAGFVASSIVQANGAPIPTTLVSPTTLTAVVPAADFVKQGTLQITVYDPTVGLTSPVLTITVAPVSPTVTLGGPTSTPPGSQPVLTFTVTPYPFPLTATLTLSFAPSVSPAVNDPAVQFANGGRTLTFTVPANSSTVPPIRVQSGTVAGTITVPLVLTANGANVTPSTVAPVVIVIPPAVPTVSSVTMTQTGNQLTVLMHGFSNTREVTQAKFHFVGVNGAQVDTPDVTIPATTLFGGWFGSTDSDQYGSEFTYTQVFTVSDGAATIQSVQVTLTNAVGDSVVETTQ